MEEENGPSRRRRRRVNWTSSQEARFKRATRRKASTPRQERGGETPLQKNTREMCGPAPLKRNSGESRKQRKRPTALPQEHKRRRRGTVADVCARRNGAPETRFSCTAGHYEALLAGYRKENCRLALGQARRTAQSCANSSSGRSE